MALLQKALSSVPSGSVFHTVDEVAKRLRPDIPVQCVFPEFVRGQAQKFTSQFPGPCLVCR